MAVAKDAVIMVDGEFAPLHDKIKAAIAVVSNQPIKYLVNTHFHGDHTGGVGRRLRRTAPRWSPRSTSERLAAGTTNGLTGVQGAPAAPGALPAEPGGAYYTGAYKISLQGRVADLEHIANAPADGDTYVWFKTANVWRPATPSPTAAIPISTSPMAATSRA